MTKTSILFVCLGNICRSPVAEGLLRKRADEGGLDIVTDSAGTGDWHIGSPPQQGSQDVARRHGLDISGLRARQVTRADWTRYTHIIALDASNLADLDEMRPDDATAELLQLMTLTEAGAEDHDVLDPYGMGPEAFDRMYAQIDAGVAALLERLLE
ncbi:MAG: low molecular weight protein-tyrosine-phosphatase [Pacificimonas sp.]